MRIADLLKGNSTHHLSSQPSPGARPLANIALLLLTGACFLLCVTAMQNTTAASQDALNDQVKQNMHELQLSVERFAVDDAGTYPAYLVGGNRYYAIDVVEEREPDPFGEIRVIEDLREVSDPLIRDGYLLQYPRNPFVQAADRTSVHLLQLAIPGSGLADPLRNGEAAEGAVAGTRFGQYCKLMGQVLADPRYPTITSPPGEPQPGQAFPSYAEVGYPFWDIWNGSEAKPYIPGAFFYKTMGILTPDKAAASASGPVKTDEIQAYIMGGYGAHPESSKDVIGDEQQLAAFAPASERRFMKDPAGTMLWPWTRSVDDVEGRGGSPYSVQGTNEYTQWAYGNPNGVRDGIIIVLTAGEDYP